VQDGSSISKGVDVLSRVMIISTLCSYIYWIIQDCATEVPQKCRVFIIVDDGMTSPGIITMVESEGWAQIFTGSERATDGTFDLVSARGN
jgi:hypothetical protein